MVIFSRYVGITAQLETGPWNLPTLARAIFCIAQRVISPSRRMEEKQA
jgi:hypothetical protein